MAYMASQKLLEQNLGVSSFISLGQMLQAFDLKESLISLEKDPNTKAILLLGAYDFEEKQIAQCMDFLTKPIDEDKIYEVTARYLKKAD